MKALIVKIDKKRACVLMPDGRFETVPARPHMKTGMQVGVERGIRKRMTRGLGIAACFAAFVFAMTYLAYCVYIYMFH